MAPKLLVVVALGAAAFLAHKAKAGGDKPAAAPKKPEIKSAPAKAASTKAAAAAPAKAASTKAAAFVEAAFAGAAAAAFVEAAFAGADLISGFLGAAAGLSPPALALCARNAAAPRATTTRSLGAILANGRGARALHARSLCLLRFGMRSRWLRLPRPSGVPRRLFETESS